MTLPKLVVGIHVGKTKNTYTESIELVKKRYESTKYLFTAFQIFVAGPQQVRHMDYEKELAEYTSKKNVIGIAHSAYIFSPWNGKSLGLTNVKKELQTCGKEGLHGLVVHLPKNTPEHVAEVIPKLLEGKPNSVMLMLEIPSVHPEDNKSYETPEKVNKLCELIVQNGWDGHVGIVPDTAHIFSGGYDLTTKQQADAWLKGLKYPKLICLIHINDSAVKLGNGRDKHDTLGKGLIWKKYKIGVPKSDDHNFNKSGLYSFIKFAQKNRIPIIIERKDHTTRYDFDVLEDIL